MTTLQWVLLIWLGIGAALQGVLAVLGSETRDWESRLILLTLGPAITYVSPKGWRQCITCRREYGRKRAS